ncbi:MAG: NYN domain-containing protein [Byssovorax sp.]
MAQQDSATNMVGVYWDFENIHASLFERAHGRDTWREQRNYRAEWLVDVRAIMGYVASIGTVTINRAYNNWQHFACYRHDFHEHSVDLVQLFPRGMKNGADIRLVLDVMEDIHHYPHLSHIVVVGGDSDFISLAQQVKRTGRTIVGVGVRETTNQFWVRCCNEFKYYDSLEADLPSAEAGDDRAEVRALLLRALRSARLQRGDDLVPKATLKSVMRRLDPSFDETRFGFESFSEFVDAFSDDLEHIRNDSGGMVRERAAPQESAARPSPPPEGPARPSPPPPLPRPPSAEPPPELHSTTRTGQAYELILRRASVLPLDASFRQRALAHLQQLMQDAPDRRLASVDHIMVNLSRQLESAGLAAPRPLLDRLKGNLLSLRMLKFHGPNGVGLSPRAEDGQLIGAVEEEMALRIVQQAALPVDLVGLTEVLEGSVSARAINEVEKLLREIAPDAPTILEQGSLVELYGDTESDTVGELRHHPSFGTRSLQDLEMLGRLGLTPLLLLKQGGARVQPGPDEVLADGDTLLVLGKSEEVQRLLAGLPS